MKIRAAGVAIGCAAIGFGMVGCKREKSAPPASKSPATERDQTASSPQSRALPCDTLEPIPLRYPAAKRVVAIGDVHGDLEATRKILREAGAIDGDDKWAGGELVVVQTGDVLDRGDQERAIMELFRRLEDEAAKAGGRFIALNGNHEFMNAVGDFRYVTNGGFEDFADVPSEGLEDIEDSKRGRVAAFLPGGPYAQMLAEQNVVAIVGDTLFAHGGVEIGAAKYGLDRINGEGRCFLAGKLDAPPEFVSDDDGPIWSRDFAFSGACQQLAEVLEIAGVKRMVVGHTTNTEGVTSDCDGAIWRIDVGLAAYYGGPPQAIELRGSTVRVLEAGP
jgi:hypothetical protein